MSLARRRIPNSASICASDRDRKLLNCCTNCSTALKQCAVGGIRTTSVSSLPLKKCVRMYFLHASEVVNPNVRASSAVTMVVVVRAEIVLPDCSAHRPANASNPVSPIAGPTAAS